MRTFLIVGALVVVTGMIVCAGAGGAPNFPSVMNPQVQRTIAAAVEKDRKL
jgi:hypothetical protein